jgi:hypothetical protein
MGASIFNGIVTAIYVIKTDFAPVDGYLPGLSGCHFSDGGDSGECHDCPSHAEYLLVRRVIFTRKGRFLQKFALPGKSLPSSMENPSIISAKELSKVI